MIQHKVIEGRLYTHKVAGGSVYVFADKGTYTARVQTLHGENCELKFADYVTVPMDCEVVGVASFASEEDLERLREMISTRVTHEFALEAWLVRLALDSDSEVWAEV